MAKPTENDWKLFGTVKNADKAKVLYAYLCRGLNMAEVAQNVLGDYNDMASQRVSNITRCYGFSGQNGGKYARYGLTQQDIEGFVKKYPDGCFECRTMDEYVRKLYESRQKAQAQPVKQTENTVHPQIQIRPHPPVKPATPQTHTQASVRPAAPKPRPQDSPAERLDAKIKLSYDTQQEIRENALWEAEKLYEAGKDKECREKILAYWKAKPASHRTGEENEKSEELYVFSSVNWGMSLPERDRFAFFEEEVRKYGVGRFKLELARCYADGIGTASDPVKAINLLTEILGYETDPKTNDKVLALAAYSQRSVLLQKEGYYADAYFDISQAESLLGDDAPKERRDLYAQMSEVLLSKVIKAEQNGDAKYIKNGHGKAFASGVVFAYKSAGKNHKEK